MKVHIENNLFLESDGLEFTIREYSGKQDKNEKDISKVLGHYSNVKSAFRGLVKMKVSQSTAKTLHELVQDVERIEQYIESKLNV